jgi:large subunit ribosomal protein L31
MKKDIHPNYNEVTVTCGCGNSFVTRSTAAKIAVEVCANCHPFFTGKQKFVDTAGMVEKFTRKWEGMAAQKLRTTAVKPAPRAPASASTALPKPKGDRSQQTMAATLGEPRKPAPAPAPAAKAPEGAPKPSAPPAKPSSAPAPKAGAPEGQPGDPAKKA